MGELDAGAIRDRRFSVVRKGYDRSEVESYLGRVANAVESLESRLAEMAGRFEQLGISEPRALVAELDAIGTEVTRVLQEARVAAEEIRRRATEDAARVGAEAEQEIRGRRVETDDQVEALRRSEWVTGTEVLEQAAATRDELIADAEQDAMLIRAEAEHEASRLTGDARRTRETQMRAVREQTEGMLAAAQYDAEGVTSAALQDAELAQQQVQALEQRRVELMAELDVYQEPVGGIDAVPPPVAAPEHGEDVENGTTGTIFDDTEEVVAGPRSHWAEDDVGSVRIVSADRVMHAGSVDADAFAAEVQALREGAAVVVEPEPDPQQEVEARPEPEPQPEPVAEAESEPEAAPESEPEAAPEPEPDLEPEPEAEADLEPVAEAELEPELETRPEAEAYHQPEPEPTPDALAGLFASLRTSTDQTTGVRANGAREAAAVAADIPSESKPTESVPQPVTTTAPLPVIADVDPFALRDRVLLPIQNRVLRDVKRQLVDLQNQALGGLRADEAWVMDTSAIAPSFRTELASLARESSMAGIEAASEWIGGAGVLSPDQVESGDPTDAFVAGLFEAVAAALVRARDADAGSRETASAVSRVFRSWRTDEAERRVRASSYVAYHRDLVAALSRAGITRIAAMSAGHGCPECPAGRGPWEIAAGPPPGTKMPPARVDCMCAVVATT